MTHYLFENLHKIFSGKFLLYSKLFADAGAVLTSPSGDGYVWRVSKDDRSIVFLSGTLPINLSPATNIARDKLAAYQVLSERKLPIPKGFAFLQSFMMASRR